MPDITDTIGAPLTSVSVLMDEGTDSPVLTALVPCLANRWLTTSDEAACRVLARLTGSGDPFEDIADNPVDLTPYDGTTQSFDFKLHAEAVAGLVHVALPVRVTANP